MVTIAGDLLIGRPPEEVYEVVLDQRNEPSYNPGMARSEKLTAGPVGAGTRFRAEMRRGPLRVPLLVEITSVDPPHRIESHSTMPGGEVTGSTTFSPAPGGTRMTWHWELRLHGWGRLLRPLAGVMGRRQERRIWTGLAHHLGQQASVADQRHS